ncbi:hypothetical protein J2Y03_003165 [Neobacillus niacini]|uniref:hypothetical protein n=1 Tax=Neobacillus niacini TaxID=86668 RepID=UPI0010D548C0|nr:hypothetical protein [Neobacillus niacini]MDR7078115.1 hypothetical protein [Neobacillus niacini]
MKIITVLALIAIAVYTFGFAVTLWREKQKMGAVAVFFLTLSIIVLPFFSVLKY